MWSWLSLWRLTLGLFPCTEPKDYHVGVQLENSARIEGRHNFDNQFSSVSMFVLITCSCNFRVLVYQYRAADHRHLIIAMERRPTCSQFRC